MLTSDFFFKVHRFQKQNSKVSRISTILHSILLISLNKRPLPRAPTPPPRRSLQRLPPKTSERRAELAELAVHGAGRWGLGEADVATRSSGEMGSGLISGKFLLTTTIRSIRCGEKGRKFKFYHK